MNEDKTNQNNQSKEKQNLRKHALKTGCRGFEK
jgi:hypothetical protein